MGLWNQLRASLNVRKRLGHVERTLIDMEERVATAELDAASAKREVSQLRGRVTGYIRKSKDDEGEAPRTRHDRLRRIYGVPTAG